MSLISLLLLFSSVLRPPSSVLPFRPWLLAALVGITFGLALMTKQPALFFLLVPLVWVTGNVVWQQAWRRLAQLGLALVVSLLVFYPWYRTNWLLILTSSKRATIDSAIAEGTPSFFSIDAWTLYLRNLPGMVSLPLLVVPLLGLVFFWRRSRVSSYRLGSTDYSPKPQEYRQRAYAESQQALGWLLVFLVSSYVLSNLNPNKDDRYVAPYLPVLSVILAYGLTLLPKSWRLLHWGSVALAGFLMIANLFPVFVGSGAAYRQYPTLNYPYQGAEFPHAQVVAEVVKTAPYLRSTIGVLPSTAAVNQHNINYYGLLQNFQVFGRQVGTRKSHLEQDQRSLPWFLTKTGDQGSIRAQNVQTAIVQSVEQGTDFQLHKTWSLPDRSTLKLYRRSVPLIEVQEIGGQESGVRSQESENTNLQSPISNLQSPPSSPLQLDEITVPTRTPPGKPIPVTYRWSGTWESLQSGLVILTWQKQGEPAAKGTNRWFHDHGIGMGELYLAVPGQATKPSRFRVIERMAMLAPADAVPGTYALKATYLDRRTGTATTIATPPITLQIDPEAIAIPAPELDLVTQFRIMANTMPQGIKALDQIFDRVARINQYDPIQDYVPQAQRAMEYRLQQEPRSRQFAYGLALATVLRRQVDPAIAAMQRVTQLDLKNPSAYAYLAFVNLYDFRPQAAQLALDNALKLNPSLPEVHALSGIAALMQGNLVRAWHEAQTYQKTQPGSR
ncbi:MAG: phospholipid carrier-dependent glycosyltransferase [Leptolyngbyaceae cyanobacterium RU_5_1]|nr:phospholipid carrier-dependent glycosyltransferase [Leptolyngbyaceae cyanobacterium RU_5_1]